MTQFDNIDETEVVIDNQKKYLYHFINQGQKSDPQTIGGYTFDLKGHIDCHHFKQAIVSAESFNEAKELLLADERIYLIDRYVVEVFLIGVDLIPGRENPVVMYERQSPIG